MQVLLISFAMSKLFGHIENNDMLLVFKIVAFF